MPAEQRWREGFFIIGLFLWVPDSLAERRRRGGQRSVCLILTNTHRPQRQSKLWRTPGRHQEGWRWCRNLDKPSLSNYCRHGCFTGQARNTKTKHSLTQSKTHSLWLLQNAQTKRSTAAHVNIRAGWLLAMRFSVGSCVRHKTSVTLMHRGECVCVHVCVHFTNRPWKAPLLKSHVSLQTLQSCCLIVYSVISGSKENFRPERVWVEVFSHREVRENRTLVF